MSGAYYDVRPGLTLEQWHAVDAPLADFDDWCDELTPGLCTACGQDAWSGLTAWWHADGARLCTARRERTPRFSPDA